MNRLRLINCLISFAKEEQGLGVRVCVCMHVCKKTMLDANRRKRRRDAEKDCCVGEVLTLFVWIMCLFNKSYHLGKPWTEKTCLNHECQNYHLGQPLLLIFFHLFFVNL